MSSLQHTHRSPADRRSVRGVTLIEALVAMLIMAFGMVALVGIQSTMRRGADLAKQRGEALRIAQQEIERARGYWMLSTPAGAPAGTVDYAGLTTQAANSAAGDADSNATFTLTRTVTDWSDASAEQPQAQAGLKALRVEVSWVDRANETQRVELNTFIAKADPALSGSMMVPPVSSPTRRPGEREASIPVQAKDLGNKTSVFVPSPTATVAWVFNNLTGVITGRCTVAMGTTSNSLSLQDVESCSNNTVGYLLSGTIRFSNSLRPDPANPEGFALPLDVVITNSRLSGAIAAPTADQQQCFDDAPTSPSSTMPFVSYNCFIAPNEGTPRIWSGRAELSGIELTGANARKVCRYSADYDGNGSISNAEHPENYNAVSYSLARQNFLVINASVSRCPSGAAINPANGVFVNSNTELQQAAPAQP